MARKTSLKQRRSPIPTIIGAGITEQWYFTHLKALRGYRVKIRPRFFGTETAAGLAKRIEEVLQDEGIAICVFDADVSSWIPCARSTRTTHPSCSVIPCHPSSFGSCCITRTPPGTLAPQKP